jgi:hypothetical protein
MPKLAVVFLPIIGVFVYLLSRPADVDAVVVYEEETVVGRP